MVSSVGGTDGRGVDLGPGVDPAGLGAGVCGDDGGWLAVANAAADGVGPAGAHAARPAASAPRPAARSRVRRVTRGAARGSGSLRAGSMRELYAHPPRDPLRQGGHARSSRAKTLVAAAWRSPGSESLTWRDSRRVVDSSPSGRGAAW